MAPDGHDCLNCDVLKTGKPHVDNLGVVFLALLAVPAQHLIRFSDEALGLGDALSEAILACLDLCCLLLSPLSALFGVRHSASTIRAELRTRDLQIYSLRFETGVRFPPKADTGETPTGARPASGGFFSVLQGAVCD